MTIKDEAKQLIDSFIPHVKWKMGQEDCLERAKECALIAVNKILDIVNSIYDYDRESLNPYWQEVKQEIEKL